MMNEESLTLYLSLLFSFCVQYPMQSAFLSSLQTHTQLVFPLRPKLWRRHCFLFPSPILCHLELEAVAGKLGKGSQPVVWGLLEGEGEGTVVLKKAETLRCGHGSPFSTKSTHVP